MGTGGRTRVIVVTHDDVSTVADCLDGIAEQGADRVDVVVVDLTSADGSADAAIRHPLPTRVMNAMPGDLDRILAIGSHGAPDGRLLVIGADLRPASGWLDAALTALEQHAVVVGVDHHRHHLALDRARLGPLALPTDDPRELCRRVRSAGETVGVARDFRTTPAVPTPGATTLPVVEPRAGGPAYDGLVSIVLCTRDRPEHAARCLASLERLHDAHHEIVVVDNNDEPSIHGGDLPPAARVVHEPRRGLDVARNRGWHEAAGDVIAYVDDDCEVDAHWLTGLRGAFADPSVRVATGRVRPATLRSPSQRWFEAHFSFDRGTERRRFTPWDRRHWYPMWPGEVGAGCNMAFRRDELEAIGGFDELLDMGTPIGGGGDLDAFTRAIDRGSIIEYRPDALVWHHHRATEGAVTRQFLGYGVTVGALVTKSALERPGQRLVAVRFFLDRLRGGVRLVRGARAGTQVLPARLVAVDLLGQLAGPAIYLATRSGAGARGRRHAQPGST